MVPQFGSQVYQKTKFCGRVHSNTQHQKSSRFVPPVGVPQALSGREGGRRGGGGGEADGGGGAFDDDRLNAYLAAALSRVVRADVPIHADAAASVLHSAAIGGFDAGVLGLQ